jgi:hypothetical protein
MGDRCCGLFFRDCSPAVTVIGDDRRPGFNPRIAHMGYTTEQVVLGHTFLGEIPLSPTNYIIPPMNHAHLSIETGTVSPFELAGASGCLYYPYF